MAAETAVELLAVLPRVEGNPYVLPGKVRGRHYVGLEKAWGRLRARAGLSDVRLHDLRHTHASVGAGAGLSLPLIGKLLGYKQTATTQRYAHLHDDPVRKAADRVTGHLAAALEGRSRFRGLPHRAQTVATVAGVTYVDDSKATNAGAAEAALAALVEPGCGVLIAGGQGKGGDFDSLARAVSDKLRAAIVFGEDRDALAASFAGSTDWHSVPDLPAAVDAAANLAQPGDTVLLAPACASFDQYDNFEARGDDFRALVGGLPT